MGGTTVTSAQERQIALEKYYENKIEDLKNQVATAPDAKALEAAAKQLAETEAKLRDHKLETATQQEEAKKAREALAAAEVKIKDAEAKVEAAAKAKEVELAEAKAKEVEAAAVEIEEEEDNSPRFNPTETVDVPVIVDTEERVVPGGTIFILKKEGGRILSVDAKHKGRLEQVIFKCSRPSGELLILDPLPEKMRMLPGRLPVVIVQKKAK
jgi:translation initiation factor IF-2